jgi:ferredoxin-NADP reductase
MELKLSKILREKPDVSTYVFKNTANVKWKAGQFIHYHLPHAHPDNRGDKRYFSIASAPHEEDIWLTTRFTEYSGSSFKKALAGIRPGQTIKIGNPEGDFVINDPDQLFVLIAGGIGITPFRSMLLDMDRKGQPINALLLYGNRDEDVVFKDVLEDLTRRHPGFKTYYVISPEIISSEHIKNLIPDYQNVTHYISGPEVMVQKYYYELQGIGVDKKNLRLDYFPGYAEV